MKIFRLSVNSGRSSKIRRAAVAGRRSLRLFTPGNVVETLEHRTLLAGGLADLAPAVAQVGSVDGSSAGSNPKTLNDLDPLARYAISASMGAEQAAYAATQTDAGYSFTNNYCVSMTTDGATFQSGADSWQFTPESFGYGADQVSIGDSQITAGKNRVTYDSANLDTWFVNGPAGVQQGFTLDHRPEQGDPSQPLVVSVGLGGSLSASVQADGLGLNLARPDGTSVMNFGGLVAYDATGKSFDARMELVPDGSGQDLHFVVDDAGAVYPLTIDPVTTITETAKLNTADADRFSSFGLSVAFSADGTTILVGAPTNGSNEAGAVYVYVKPTMGWASTSTYTAKLSLATNGEIYSTSYKAFGGTLSISADGGTALIGTSYRNYGSYYGGSAYIFTRPVGGWVTTSTYTARFKTGPGDGSAASGFGRSVSLSSDGNTAVVGASQLEYGSLGAVFVYQKLPSGWPASHTAKLTLQSTQTDYFGDSVSVSGDGNTVLITAPGYGAKAAYIFTKPVSGWVDSNAYTAKFNMYTSLIYSCNLSSDASTALVCSDSNVFIYTRPSNGIWVSSNTATARLSMLGSPLTVASQSADGSRIIAGAYMDPPNNTGAVYIFNRPDQGWQTTSVASIKAAMATPVSGSQLGISVALTSNGNSLVTGAIGYGSVSALVYNLNSPATLLSSPSNAGVAVGNTGTFTANAIGAPAPRVQWQVSTDNGGSWTDIAGAINYTYTTPTTVIGDDGKQFRAVFSNTYSGTTYTATSTAATMTVGYAPVVTSQPATVSLNAGATATFTAAASGTPTPTVQWYKSTDFETAATPTWTAISGATSLSYTTPVTVKADNNTFYKARFTNAIGTTDTNATRLTVLFAPEIVTQPVNSQVTGGTTASFTAVANGGPTPSVQWQVSTDSGSTWADVSGATSTTYSFTAMGPDSGKEYRAVFTSSQGSVTTNAATLTVLPGFLSPSSTSFQPGLNNSFQVTFTSAQGATLSTNYDYWATTFPSLPQGWKLGGNASISSNTAILTQAQNSQQGTLVMPAIGVKSPAAFTATFQHKTSNSGGADGMSFNYGLIPASPTGSEMGILSNNTGLVVSIIEWQTDRIEAYYNGTQLASVNYDLGGGSYRDVKVTVNAANQLLVNVAGQTIMSVALPASYATVDKSAWQYGFGARTGGANSEHSIKNLTISTPATLPPGVTFNPTTGVLSGVPGIGSAGSFGFSLVATDANGSTIQPFTLNVPVSPVLPGQRNGAVAGFVGSTGQQVNNDSAFAALDASGAITVYGNASKGGTLPASLTGGNAANNIGFVKITSSRDAFAALKADGSIVCWGDSMTIANSPSGTGFTAIASTSTAFAALKADGSITVWGDSTSGGTLPNNLTGVNASNNIGFVKLFSNNYAFIAMKADGTLVSWGKPEGGGASSGNSMAPANDLANPFVQIFSNSRKDVTEATFAAMRADGSFVTWGNDNNGGNGEPGGTGWVYLATTKDAYAALRNDGTISVWGNSTTGGSGGPSGALSTGYTAIYATHGAFVAVRTDGSLYAWGHSNDGGTGAPSGTGFVTVASTTNAFAALNANGSISAWGNSGLGGSLPGSITGANAANNSNFVRLFSNGSGFVGLKADGSTVTWGSSTVTANAPAASVKGFAQIFSNNSAFFGLASNGSYVSWGDTTAGGGFGGTGPIQTLQTGTVGIPYYSSSISYPTGFTSGQAASLDFSAQGLGIYYTIASGSLPTGMSLNSATGVVSGTPPTDYTGPATFTIQATSAIGSTSRAVTLTPQYAPVISTQPTDSLVNAGENATYIAAAAANPAATVKWQSKASGSSNWTDIAGETHTAYTRFNVAAGDNGMQFRAVFTNTIGSTTTSEVSLVVLSAPAVTLEPVNKTGVVGSSATFTATASGNPLPTIKWQKSPDGSTGWTDITGEVSGTLSLNPALADSGTYYRAVFTNPAGTVNSQAAMLTVNELPQVSSQPSDLTILTGSTATFTAAATGTPTPSVVWQTSDNGVNTWVDIAGATSPTYSFTATLLDTGKWYRAMFSNAAGLAGTAPVMLTVTSPPAPPVMQTQPQNQTSQAGNTNTFIAVAVGSPTPTVQWQQSSDGTNWSSVTGGSGANTTIFTTPALAQGDNGLKYRALFTNTDGSVASNVVTLSIVTPPAVTQEPANQTGNQGVTVSFSAAASGDPAPNVQWEESTDNGANWSRITGATSVTYTTATLTGADNGKLVRAVFSNGNGADAVTNAVNLTVNYISTQPASQTLAVGQTATLTTAAVSTTSATVQWQLSTNNGSTWADIAGATATSYTTPAFTSADNGNQYRAVFTNSLGTMTSTAASLSVQFAPSITLQPTNQEVQPGYNTTFLAAATGNPTPTAKWQVSTNGGTTWSDIAGATSASYSFTVAQGDSGNQYRAVFTNGIGSDATTNAATLTVGTTPVIITGDRMTLAVGLAGGMSVIATGSPAPQYSIVTGTLPSGVTLDATTGLFSGTPASGTVGTYPVTIQASNGIGTAWRQAFTLNVISTVTSFVISKGQLQRSYIRYIDVGFESAASALAIKNNPTRLTLIKQDLDGVGITTIPISASWLSTSGNKLGIDFGSAGLGNSRNTSNADGYYALSVDVDGTGNFITNLYFYRLFGDTNGDRQVNSQDETNVLVGCYNNYIAILDINGDGKVNTSDLIYVKKAVGRRLRPGIIITN